MIQFSSPLTQRMKFVLVLVGAGSLAFLGAVICIIASVYPRKHASFPGDNSTLGPEALMEPLEPLELTGSDSYRGENGLGGLEVPGLNHVHLGEDTGGGSAKQFSFSRLICTPVPPEEDWSFLRTTAEDLRQMVVQQNDQILMDQRTIRELTGKLNECESGLEDERNVPERSIGVWSGNRRVMAGDDVSSSAAAQLQTARAVEELARAIMDLKDRIEKLEAEIGPAALNLSDLSPASNNPAELPLPPLLLLFLAAPPPPDPDPPQLKAPPGEGSLEGGGPGGGAGEEDQAAGEGASDHEDGDRGPAGETEPGHRHGRRQGAGAGDKTNYMYGLVRKEISEMYAFTACVWLKVREGGIGTPFSYSVPGQPNELVAQLPLMLTQDTWQHICVSWTLRDGDTLGGHFDASQALVGDLSQFNLWDRVLKPAEVLALSECSSSALGNIAPWTDLDVDVYGGATKESLDPCHAQSSGPKQ
ncbi:hypothetical protein F7725_006266 [Dissostichus mawsoni]|uniref:Pentraxin (PTX) domain-containing protein n=1 Tax=Dissostichus mawsoni TaxID=36200 RepID=A0A7J5YVQ7_DISMA|nr:hypothetical protein F7725_006266 [Dissostichus mawsoni]